MTTKRAKAKTTKPRKKKVPLPRRMTPDERRDFVLAWCNGTITSSNEVPSNLLTVVFFPLFLGALSGYRKRDLAQIGLIWADSARDQTMGAWAVNGFPCFASCRIMLQPDWEELKPKISAELKRREELKA